MKSLYCSRCRKWVNNYDVEPGKGPHVGKAVCKCGMFLKWLSSGDYKRYRKGLTTVNPKICCASYKRNKIKEGFKDNLPDKFFDCPF